MFEFDGKKYEGRVTSKRGNNYDVPAGEEDVAIHRLGLLEDKEKELGIDLNTLLECTAVWFRDENGEVRLALNVHIDLYMKRLVDINIEEPDIKPLYFYFKDYGKKVPYGWALTPAELKGE